jgi:hypothetical protein
MLSVRTILLGILLLTGCEFCQAMQPDMRKSCQTVFPTGCDANHDGLDDPPSHCEPAGGQ